MGGGGFWVPPAVGGGHLTLGGEAGARGVHRGRAALARDGPWAPAAGLGCPKM